MGQIEFELVGCSVAWYSMHRDVFCLRSCVPLSCPALLPPRLELNNCAHCQGIQCENNAQVVGVLLDGCTGSIVRAL